MPNWTQSVLANLFGMTLAIVAVMEPASSAERHEYFPRPLLVELLNDGRNIKLTADFDFVEPHPYERIQLKNEILELLIRQQGGIGNIPDENPKAFATWHVPAGFVSDGASIPRALWSIIGSPLTGKYRNAAIIHDYFCRNHNFDYSSEEIHEVFYRAMIASGVSNTQAGIMYYSVLYYWYITKNNKKNPGFDGT
jgi:hypothetical protein